MISVEDVDMNLDMMDDLGVETETDVDLIAQAWLNERACPDLLTYEYDLVARLLEGLEVQVDPSILYL